MADVSPELLEAIRQVCKTEMRAEIEQLRQELAQLRMRLPAEGQEVQPPNSSRVSNSTDPYNQSAAEGYALLTKQETSISHMIGDDTRQLEVTLTDKSADVEAKSQEYRDIVDNANVEVDVASDVWGATMFVILKDIPHMLMGDIRLENCLRCAMITLCVLLNFFLQFAFLFWIADLVLLPNISNLQELYRKFHEFSFKTGYFDEDGFEQLTKKERLKVCEMAMSTTLFTAACLFLWIARCLNELAIVFRRTRSIDSLPLLPPGVAPTHMVHELQLEIGDYREEHKNLVVCLNRSTRVWLYLLIFIPRCVIAGCLLVMGTAFLTATQSFTELILNSLAMSFVYDIDELLMAVFLPQRLKANLERTKIVTPSEEHMMHLSPKELDRHNVKYAYSASAFKLFTVIAVVAIWFTFQPIIPGYEYDVQEPCKPLLTSIKQISCKPWDEDCFPK
mmetsp:Transcript_127152/g.245194  ORF Transcript_127152/g.245194 Transcript_127152/m.245194 type:complete len:449 (+) Transcript_127152:72-1418(+)